MKRYLLLCFSVCVALATTAAPWDIKASPQKVLDVSKPFSKAFTDPYVTNYGAYDLQPNTFYHRVRVTVNFNQTVGVPYYAVIRVYGDFSNGDYYREYTLLLSGAQWTKSQEFSVGALDEIYTEVTELVDYGPQ